MQQIQYAVINGLPISLADIEILAETEKHQLHTEWNDTSRLLSHPSVLHMLELEALRRSEDLVITCGPHQLIYSELNRRSNQLARFLTSLGSARGHKIALAVERGIDMIVGMLAIWKARAVFVPLDPAYPRERLEFIIKDSSIRIIVTNSGVLAIKGDSIQVVDLDQLADQIATQDPHNLPLDIDGSDLAYVIYTSGSTGKPKGVEVEHANLANVIQGASFANASGMPTVIQNSGSNVLIQNATVINLQFK